MAVQSSRTVANIKEAFERLYPLLMCRDFGRGKNHAQLGEKANLVAVKFFLAGALARKIKPEAQIQIGSGNGYIDFVVRDDVAVEFEVIRKRLRIATKISELRKLTQHSIGRRRGVFAILDFSDRPWDPRDLKKELQQLMEANNLEPSREFWLLYYFAGPDGRPAKRYFRLGGLPRRVIV